LAPRPPFRIPVREFRHLKYENRRFFEFSAGFRVLTLFSFTKGLYRKAKDKSIEKVQKEKVKANERNNTITL
jgi:hypothetical protein